MKLITNLIFILCLASCQESNDEVTLENTILKAENDSLKNELEKTILRPYIDNTDFTISVSDTFNTNFLTVVKNGMIVDSIEIIGLDKNRTNKMIDLSENDFGTHLMFMPDSVGTFEMKAFSRVIPWGHRVIPLSFQIETTKN